MNEGFQPWLIARQMLSGDLIARNGMGKVLMERYGLDNADALFVLHQMDVTHQNAVHRKRIENAERERNDGGLNVVGGGGIRRRG